jgi:hypothetical protein
VKDLVLIVILNEVKDLVLIVVLNEVKDLVLIVILNEVKDLVLVVVLSVSEGPCSDCRPERSEGPGSRVLKTHSRSFLACGSSG